MPKVVEGGTTGDGRRIGVVVARFNEFVTRKLLEGALDTLARHGVDNESVTVAWTPGAFELPLTARKMAASGNFGAVIALGCVIRGATPHFDYVAGEAARGITQASLETGVPIIFGVLTTDTIEQAMERASTEQGNKGAEAAAAALEMTSLLEQL